MRICTIKIGRANPKARPAMARPRFCPTCGETKPARDFRQSNRNSRLSIVCWQCRHDKPNAERQLLAAPALRKRPLKKQSDFRQKVFAVCRELRPKTKRREANQVAAIKKQAVDLVRLPDRIAAIIGKSFAVRGDDATIPDD